MRPRPQDFFQVSPLKVLPQMVNAAKQQRPKDYCHHPIKATASHRHHGAERVRRDGTETTEQNPSIFVRFLSVITFPLELT